MIWESYIMCYSLILRNIISTCWRVLDQSVSELSNMERLDITLTKFIKLQCTLVDVRFRVYTQNFLSLKWHELV